MGGQRVEFGQVHFYKADELERKKKIKWKIHSHLISYDIT